MAPRKAEKMKNSHAEPRATMPTNRRSTLRRRPGGTLRRSPPTQQESQELPPPRNTRLLSARDYLRTRDLSTSPNFVDVCDDIQSFIDDLASAKEIFDIKMYNDVRAMLRVHGERLNERPGPSLPLARTVAPPASSSSSPSSPPSKVFTDDLAYDGPSSASTVASPNSKLPMLEEEEQQEQHPYQEGELLTFEPRPFGPKGPGYSHPAPKEVMGFDPVNGFGRRSITSSEEEMFPGTESAKKRVTDKGFAQVDLSKKSKKEGSRGQVVGGGEKRESEDKLVELVLKPMVQEWVAESKRDKGKGKAEEVEEPDVVSERISPSRTSPVRGKVRDGEVSYPDLVGSKQASPTNSKGSRTKATPQSPNKQTSPKKPTFPKPSESTSPKRPHDEGFIDPITLSNKRIKFQQPEPEILPNEPAQDYVDDDIEARRVFGVDDSFNEEAPTGEDNDKDGMDMQIEEPADVHHSDFNAGSGTIVTSAHQEEQDKAAVAEPKAERSTFSGLSRFAKRFLQPWRVDHQPKNEDHRNAHQGFPVRESVPLTSQSQPAGHLNGYFPAKERSVEDTHEPKDSNDEEYIDEDTVFVPLAASETSPTTPRSPKSEFLAEIEREEAKEKLQDKKPKTKATSPNQQPSYGSPTPRFAVVPPTPPTFTGSKGIGSKEVKEVRGSTLPVPVVMPLTPPPSKSSATKTRKEAAKDTSNNEASKKQSTAAATLREAARKYRAAEAAALKARGQRDAILKEAKAEEIKQKASQATARFKMAEKQGGKARSSSSKMDSRLPTPPMSSPARTTTSPKASAAQKSTPTSSSSGPPYGHFGLIPPEIANAPITYPPPKHKHDDQKQNKRRATIGGKSNRDTRFYPGDPIFLFGETRYLTALKSRQIEKDLASNDRDVQAEIDSRPLFGMFARYRLPKPPVWWEAEMERGREKVVKGRVQKTRRKRGESNF
ncbi:MAG: hypothetical protein Q9199_006093 [Rusavskia elegans]